MPEMTPAERVALDTLRKSALAQMSDADFANLEAEVALKGIRNLDGWFASEVRKAVEQVLKHPGHANQQAHAGGKGKGGGGASAPETAPVSSTTQSKLDRAEATARKAGQKEGASSVHEVNAQGIKEQRKQMEQSDVKMSVNQAHRNDQLFQSMQESAGQYDQLASDYRMKGDSKRAKAAESTAAEYRDQSAFHFQLAGAWASHATDLGASEKDLIRVQKTVEPVVKHPGQHDQSVHGGGKGGGKSPSATPAPASSGGSSAPSFKVGDKVEFTDKYGGGKTTLVRGRVVGITPKGKLKIKPKNPRQHGTLRTIDPKRVSEGHSPPDPSRSRAGRLGAKTRSDNELPPTYTSML